MVEIDIFSPIVPTLITLAVIVPLIIVIWNVSKKYTLQDADLKQLKELHVSDIDTLKQLLAKEVTDLKESRANLLLQYSEKLRNIESLATNRIAETRLETKEEVSKSTNQSKNENTVIQRQVDNLKSDIKDLSTRITTVNTKTEYIETAIGELKQCDASNHKFHTDWNQRVEDTIKEVRVEIGQLRSEFLNMFTGFHGGNKSNGHENK